MRRAPRQLYGFTLTELAIVLGIVGLILGAVWVAAAEVYHQWRVTTLERQIMQTVSNAKLLYKGQLSNSSFSSTPNDFTTEFGAGMFPGDFLRPGVTGVTPCPYVTVQGGYPYCDWALNASVLAGVPGAPNYPAVYRIQFSGFTDTTVCIDLLTYFGNQDGVRDLLTDVNGWGPETGNPTIPRPFTPALATTACPPIWAMAIAFDLN